MQGLEICRRFTSDGGNPYEGIKFEKRVSELKNLDGSEASASVEVVVPAAWNQVASDILAQKYIRQRGIPKAEREHDARQVFHRLAGCWQHWGLKSGYFTDQDSAAAFYDEVCFMLAHQYAAPNSPQWFNTGLNYAYGLKGKGQGHYYVCPETNELKKSASAYERPQPHACFIQSVDDNLVNDNGIMDLWQKEARLFKYGSGTGTNFSSLRGAGEPLSGGGVSSGLMSFLRVGDRAAGAIKSGGTTRRAAKMVCLDVDHPDILEFVNWKLHEEQKVAALVGGSTIINTHLKRIFSLACAALEDSETDLLQDKELAQACLEAKRNHVSDNYIARAIHLAQQGVKEFDFPRYSFDWNSEAYQTVSGQNSNNSVRITAEFMQALRCNTDWELIARANGKALRTVGAKELWDNICYAAWSCADPGIQYDTTINEWHTCLHDGRIRASNPCSEYMFLDDTACNLASVNLIKFYDREQRMFDIAAFRHACRIWTVVLDISMQMAQFPSPQIAQRSWEYRTLGLGYANIGALLMTMGVAYDSKKALAVSGGITALMTATAYATSAELAKHLGVFPRFSANREGMLRVIANHRAAAYDDVEFNGLTHAPMRISSDCCPADLLQAARSAWDEALSAGDRHGYRNAQTTVIAPTGTIGLLMDCDTTGIEPDFALVKFKKLAGGGYFKIINQSVPPALEQLGYRPQQVREILTFCVGSGTLAEAPRINFATLKDKGFTDAKLIAINKDMPYMFDISFAFSKQALGEEFCRETLNIPTAQLNSPDFSVLSYLGFSPTDIELANDYVCGTMTLEGAPHLRAEHLPIFDCANKCGKRGKRFISPQAHLRMLAAAQPFVSGAISKTINLPYEARVNDVSVLYEQAWKLGIKAIALYRDGAKLSQPLSAAVQMDWGKMLAADSTHEKVMHVSSKLQYSVRRELPSKRSGYTQKVRMEGHSIYLRTGEYENGDLGEIFLDINKEGTLLGGMMNCFAIAVSLGLQYGVPLDEFVDVFTFSRFEPSGMVVGHSHVKNSTSIIDFLFRDLAINYLGRGDLGNVRQVQDKSVVQSAHTQASEYDLARVKGYEGDPCPACNSLTMVRNGACLKCLSCGETSGCS
ncbi:MAG: adenosylcobalamin-dependent ribonucleoside-diphosphate reductase [Pseudomonadota bacterium]|nr:adenosylcobalamin-dependent ribonucleoside-diphosphate reductase [Pseudomonadota bacterium]